MLGNLPSRRGSGPVALVTGFEPFDEAHTNPSAQAAQALQGERIEGHRIVTAVLPTAFHASTIALNRLIEQHRPALVLCCGQAGGRPSISLERVAINVDDARIPDNAGTQPVDEPVVPGGPAAYFSSLPIKAMRDALLQAGIAAEVSQTAGTFVCNHVFYGLMHLLAQPPHRGVRGGFVHVPWLPEQGTPSMPLAQIEQGLRIALACALATREDIRVAGGALH